MKKRNCFLCLQQQLVRIQGRHYTGRACARQPRTLTAVSVAFTATTDSNSSATTESYVSPMEERLPGRVLHQHAKVLTSFSLYIT